MEKVQVASPGVVLLIDEYIPKVWQSGTDGKMKMNHHSLHGKMIGNTIGFGSTTVSDGYGSIPINTIFRGMNIHKSQLF